MTAPSNEQRPLGIAGRVLLLLVLIAGIGLARYDPFTLFFYSSYAAVGGLLAIRRPRNVIGWLLVAMAILAPYTANNTLAVAGSTLLAAALFQPLRARVQRAVDRRFNRARVDAQLAIDRFGVHLRDDEDLTALRVRLVRVASEAVQPTGAGLWIREAGS